MTQRNQVTSPNKTAYECERVAACSNDMIEAGRAQGTAITALQKAGQLNPTAESEIRQLNSKSLIALASFLNSNSDLSAHVLNLANQDPRTIASLASFLRTDTPLIDGMQQFVSQCVPNGDTQALTRARQAIVKDRIEEAVHLKLRISGDRSLCVETQFVRNHIGSAEYARAAVDLMTTGSTRLDSGALLYAPEGWTHHIRENDIYASQSSSADIVMCATRFVVLANDPSTSSQQREAAERQEAVSNYERGSYAAEAREKVEALTGRDDGYFVACGRLALLFGLRQYEMGLGPAEISVRWQRPDLAASGAAGNVMNHFISLEGVSSHNGELEVAVANGWGESLDRNMDLSSHGPSSRRHYRQVFGQDSELCNEVLSLSQVQDIAQWSVIDTRVLSTQNSIGSAHFSLAELQRVGFRSVDEFEQYLQTEIVDRLERLGGEGISNIFFTRSGDGVTINIDLSREELQPDLSTEEDCGVTGFDLYAVGLIGLGMENLLKPKENKKTEVIGSAEPSNALNALKINNNIEITDRFNIKASKRTRDKLPLDTDEGEKVIQRIFNDSVTSSRRIKATEEKALRSTK